MPEIRKIIRLSKHEIVDALLQFVSEECVEVDFDESRILFLDDPSCNMSEIHSLELVVDVDMEA